MSKIDWSKAPEWADGHGLVAHHGITEVWINMDQYAVVGAEDRAYPYGGGTGDHRHNFTRGQVQYITPRPARWDGEGLPAVGTKCEFKANVLGWVEATITAVTDLGIVFTRPSYQNGRPLVEERLPHKAVERFRPIRTPEQIAADEGLHKLRNAHTAIARTLECFRGDIPAGDDRRRVQQAGDAMTDLIEVKTSALHGEALGWAVGIAEGLDLILEPPQYGNPWRVFARYQGHATERTKRFNPWEDWALGGGLIEERMVSLHCPQSTDDVWAGWVITNKGEFCQAGDSALISGCRAIVAATLGDTVHVPKELMP